MNANEVIAYARRRGRAPERPRQHGAVVERRLPVGRAPRRARPRSRTTCCRRSSALAASLEREGRRVRRRRQVGPHPLDGRGARHARPGVRGLRGAGAPGRSPASRTRCRASARSRSAAPPPARASTRTRSSPRACASTFARDRPAVSAPADPFEAQAARDGLVEASGALKVVAVSLTKIANDLRFLGSGPRAGLAEIFLPELQKGSSIMPGKVNPVIPEVVTQVAAQVIGNDAAITIGGMNGHFELNVYVPLMARNLLQSIKLLASASRLLAEKCVDGIEANREHCESYAELTLSAATALNPVHRLRQGVGDREDGRVRRVGRCARSRARRAWRRACSTRRSTTTRWRSRTASAFGWAGPTSHLVCPHGPRESSAALCRQRKTKRGGQRMKRDGALCLALVLSARSSSASPPRARRASRATSGRSTRARRREGGLPSARRSASIGGFTTLGRTASALRPRSAISGSGCTSTTPPVVSSRLHAAGSATTSRSGCRTT